MKWILLALGALVAWIIYKDNLSSGDSGITIPSLVAPVVAGNSCVGKTDAQGNWYGLDLSGNCTIEAMGGDGGTW